MITLPVRSVEQTSQPAITSTLCPSGWVSCPCGGVCADAFIDCPSCPSLKLPGSIVYSLQGGASFFCDSGQPPQSIPNTNLWTCGTPHEALYPLNAQPISLSPIPGISYPLPKKAIVSCSDGSSPQPVQDLPSHYRKCPTPIPTPALPPSSTQSS